MNLSDVITMGQHNDYSIKCGWFGKNELIRSVTCDKILRVKLSRRV